MVLEHGRMPLITRTYAGMFGPMSVSGSVCQVYYVTNSKELTLLRNDEESGRPRLILHNTGIKGVRMRREICLGPEGTRLIHDVTVPADVVGSIDTGFTLNKELTVGARVTYWTSKDGEPLSGRAGSGDDCLPHQTRFQRIVFESRWGKLSVEFMAGDHMQDYGSLLNLFKGKKKKLLFVQILPLSQTTAGEKPIAVHKSVCMVRFEPTPGTTFRDSQRNYLYNASFEDWANPDLPDGWKRSPHATEDNGAGISLDENTRVHGARSLRWTTDSGAISHIAERRNYGIQYLFRAPYVFSIHLKSEPPGVRVALRCERCKEIVAVSGEWERYAVVATNTSRPRRLAFSIEKLSAGTLWMDAAQFEQGEEPRAFLAKPTSDFIEEPPFPAGLLEEDIEKLVKERPALGGCGPELSYYTTETEGKLIYEVNLDETRTTNAYVAVELIDPAGETIKRAKLDVSCDSRVILDFDPTKLPLGISSGLAKLVDGGKSVASVQHDIVKYPPIEKGAEVKIDRLRRVVLRGGKPYIPLGSDAGGSPDRVIEAIRAQRANGFNHLHLWSGFYTLEQTESGGFPRLRLDDLQQILDQAHSAGMTVTVNLGQCLMINHCRKTQWRNKGLTDTRLIELALGIVRRFRAHPAVLSWHVIDEPHIPYCLPEFLERAYREVKKTDPYHLAEINVGGTGKNMLPFIHASELMSVDIYPVPTSHVGIVAPHTRFMWLAGGWRPLRWWIQSWGGLREPTAAEEMCMAYQAIVEGTRFVLFYNYRPTSYAAWSGLGQFAQEVCTLTPALVSESTGDVTVEDGAGRIAATLRQVDRQVWVIAVNCDTKSIDAEFVLPADCRDTEVEVMFESRRLRVDGLLLRDRFPPMARHVYRIGL